MIKELQTAFKDILYHDGSHKYYHEDQELTSVTKFLSQLKPKFNEDFWATYKAYEFSGYKVKMIWNNYQKFLTSQSIAEPIHFDNTVFLNDDHSHLKVQPNDVKIQWKLDSLVGTTRGTFIHNYLETLENRILDEPKIEIPLGLGTGQGINYFNSLLQAKELCKKYVEWAKENLILVAAEFSIGDPKLGLAGRFDRLYFNLQTNQYEIWDFKTDKQLRYKSSFGKLQLFNIPDCEFEKYSLQTSLYKMIIEDNLNIKLGESKIVWFNLKENLYEIIPTTNYVQLIKNINHDDWSAYSKY